MNELVNFLAKKLGIACDYVEDNFNEILSSYARYKITSNIITAIACALFVIFTIVYIIICMKSYNENSKYHNILYEKIFGNYELRLGPTCIMIILIVLSGLASYILIYSINNAVGWSMSPLLKLVENIR